MVTPNATSSHRQGRNGLRPRQGDIPWDKSHQLEQTEALAELRHLQEHGVTPKAIAGTSHKPGAGHGVEDAPEEQCHDPD